MSEQPKTEVVEIATLVVDGRFQIRSRGLDRGTVNNYAGVLAAGQIMPPIKVAMVGGAAILVDGFHRVAAMAKIGQRATEVEIVQAASGEEARWLGAAANLCNALPLKPRELRGVFKAYVDAGRHRKGRRFQSYRDIEAALGGRVRHTTVHTWMRKDFPGVARAMAGGRDADVRSGAKGKDAAASLAVSARSHVEQMLAAAHGLTPDARGELIALVEAALQALRTGAPWEASSQDF